MDPDITSSSNKNSNQTYLKSNGYDLSEDDFFTELFPEYKSVNSFPETKNSVNTYQGAGNISDSYSSEISAKHCTNMMNGHAADEISTNSEKLKALNKELKEKIINQESEIAHYEKKLAKTMSELFTTKMSMDNLKKEYENFKKENVTLKEEINHFQARIHQLEELKKIREDNEINLRKDLSVKEKLQRKLKNDLRTSTQKLAEKSNHLKKVKSTNKRLWTLITEFGKTLSKAGLLTAKHKKTLLKEHAEDMSSSDVETEEESSKDVKAFFSEITATTDDKLCSSSGIKIISDSSCVHSTVSPPLQSEGFAEVNNDKSSSYSALKSTTNEASSEISKISNICSSAFLPKSDNLSNHPNAQPISSTTVKSTNSTNSCAKVKSFGSNYFLKSCKDVLDDPHMTDCHIDATYKELQDLRQQLPVVNEHFSPISPLPRTPSPRNLKTKLQPSIKAQLLRPSGKRLTFCHQQSESFDVHETQPPPENSDCLLQNRVNNVPEVPSSLPDPHKYTLSTKRNADGSLKFHFNANVNTQLCLDMNTLQVSCIVMPQNDSHSNFSGSNHPCIPSSIPSHAVCSSDMQPQGQFHYSPLQFNNDTLVSGEVIENRKQNISELNNKHNNSNQISIDRLESPALNDTETEKNPKKVKLDIISSLKESHVSNQESSELLTSVERNTHKKNHKQFQDCQTKYTNEKKEVYCSNNNMSEKVNFDGTHSAFSLPSAALEINEELQNMISNTVIQPIPISIINSSNSYDGKKIKRGKSIGKVNIQKCVLDNNKNNLLSDKLLMTPSSSESQYATSSSPEEKVENITSEKKNRKRVRRELKRSRKEVLSNHLIETGIVADNDVKDDKEIINNKTLSENRSGEPETESKSNNDSSNSSNIWLNEKSSIFKVPGDSKSAISLSENLSEANKLKSLPSNTLPSKVGGSILSNLNNSTNSNFFVSLKKELPSNENNSVFDEDSLQPDVKKHCSVVSETCLLSPSRKENIDVLMPFSPDKNTDLEKAEDTNFINNIMKNDTNCNQSQCHETLQEKLCNYSITIPEKNENKLLYNEEKLSCISEMFTPKGLFAINNYSDEHKEKNSVLQESAANIPKLSSKSFFSTTPVKTPVPLSNSPEKKVSPDMNFCANDHNVFLSGVQNSGCEQNDDCELGTPQESHHKNYASDKMTHTNGFLTSINSETGENTLGIVCKNNEANPETKDSNNFFDSEDMDTDDLNSEHTLVIAENLDNEESSKVVSDVDNSESFPKLNMCKSKSNKKKLAIKSNEERKFPNGKLNQSVDQKWQVSGSKSKDVSNPAHLSIASAFDALDQMKFTDMHFKKTQHTLVNALINPNNASGTKDVVYHILKYLSVSKSNPFLNYHIGGDETSLFPLTEKCIVSALIAISRKQKQRLQGILESTINTIYHVVLTKDKFSIYGLSSLCRVITELCKCKSDKEKPLMLCCDLLKIQHKYTPYLIASIAGVWKELFDVHTVSVEERILHSSIAYGVQKKPKSLTEQQWIHCKKVLSSHLSATPFTKVKETLTSVIEIIEMTVKIGLLKDEYIVTTPIITIAAVEGWEWTKEHLIDEHIIPLMVKFSEQEPNAQAFILFSNLYVDICNFCPDIEEPNEVLLNFFETGNEGADFIKNAVAMAQMKLILLKKLQLLPEHLTVWVNVNQNNAEIADFAQKLFQRRLMMDENELLNSEIL